jgi:2-dehydropantoate 2-reductase
MQEIQKVAILGTGAVGAYFAACFQESLELSVVLIADGRRYEKLKKDGIVINGKPYLFPVVRPSEAESPADLILVALKNHHLKEAIPNLGKLVGEETIFLSMMNGLESEEYIGSIYGMQKVLYAISLGIDAVRQGNQVTYTNPGTHIFGEAKNPTISPKVQRVQEAFKKAGINYRTPEDMTRMLWWKFMINVGINQASAVIHAPYSVFQINPDAQALMEALMQEVVSLAKVSKVNLTQQDIKDWYPVLNRLSPEGKTSMLQDIEARRKTEVEVFGGKVIELGRAYGVPTPVNQTVFQIIRILEQ